MSLSHACRTGNIQRVRELLVVAEHKEDGKKRRLTNIGRTNVNEKSPVHTCCRSGHAEILKLLIQHYGQQEVLKAASSLEDGTTALHLAAENGHSDVVRLLLDMGCELDQKDRWGVTAFYVACIGGHVSIVSMLGEAGADPNCKGHVGCAPIHQVVLNRDIPVLEVLATMKKIDVNLKDGSGRTALHLAVLFEAPLRVFDILLDAGAKIVQDANGETPLYRAIRNRQIAVASSIIKARPAVVSQLLEPDQSTHLHRVCRLSNTVMSKVLIDYGARVEKKDGKGRTALHDAVAGWHEHAIETVKMLLSDGVYPAGLVDQIDNNGYTTIHEAVTCGKLGGIVKLLVPKSSNLNRRNVAGKTAFALACQTTKPDIVKCLVEECLVRCEGRNVREHLYDLFVGKAEEQGSD